MCACVHVHGSSCRTPLRSSVFCVHVLALVVGRRVKAISVWVRVSCVWVWACVSTFGPFLSPRRSIVRRSVPCILSFVFMFLFVLKKVTARLRPPSNTPHHCCRSRTLFQSGHQCGEQRERGRGVLRCIFFLFFDRGMHQHISGTASSLHLSRIISVVFFRSNLVVALLSSTTRGAVGRQKKSHCRRRFGHFCEASGRERRAEGKREEVEPGEGKVRAETGAPLSSGRDGEGRLAGDEWRFIVTVSSRVSCSFEGGRVRRQRIKARDTWWGRNRSGLSIAHGTTVFFFSLPFGCAFFGMAIAFRGGERKGGGKQRSGEA